MKILRSSEDYLEMILMLHEKKGYVRSVDIAGGLGVTKPSVSYAVKKLRENGYISVAEYGLISLTELGMKIASSVYERHTMLAEFLILLGVDEKTAREDACRMEHDISEKSFDAMCRHAGRDRQIVLN